MNFPMDSIRTQMLRYFRHVFGPNPVVGELRNVLLPSFTYSVVSEISSSKAVPQDLALLSFLPSIAVADRGHTRVVTSNGALNALSLFVAVGAESGTGKSRSLEDALDIFAEWQSEKEEEVRGENRIRAFANKAIDERMKVLMRKFAKKGDATILEALHELNEAKSEILPLPQLLLNDVTEAAYTQQLVATGMAMRLESDGIQPPKKAMRVMTKAWTGEDSSRKRVTSPDGNIRDPFVVDLVMTQPDFFTKFISTREFLESGLMARTLVYRFHEMEPVTAFLRPMNEGIREGYRAKLRELLEISEPLEKGVKPHRLISVSREAENFLLQRQYIWKKDAAYGGPLYRIREFVARMAQHAIRLAGCLYLAEFPVDSDDPIPLCLMETAIAMTEVFLSHSLRWAIKDYEDVNVECCRAIMLHILEKNFPVVLEKELKQALRHHYDAADVNVALHYLQMMNHLHEIENNSCWMDGKRKRGRPAGREFGNPYYAPCESAF